MAALIKRDETAAINRQRLAEALVALRERLGITVYRASRGAGVPEHFLRRLETEKIPSPGIGDMALIAKYYGIDLNDIGALAGVWDTPEVGEEAVSPINAAIAELRQLARTVDETEQSEFIAMLSGLRVLWAARKERPRMTESSKPDPRLPAWLAAKVGAKVLPES